MAFIIRNRITSIVALLRQSPFSVGGVSCISLHLGSVISCLVQLLEIVISNSLTRYILSTETTCIELSYWCTFRRAGRDSFLEIGQVLVAVQKKKVRVLGLTVV